jgi:predicted methyltransferase
MTQETPAPVVCHIQAKEILAALRRGEPSVLSSADLNLTRAPLTLADDRVLLPRGRALDGPTLETIAADDALCARVDPDGAYKIAAFSEETGRYYSLYPTSGAPTMLISGIPMHRIKETDPWADTRAKIRAVGPLAGDVLDTCTGLGYTALEAARTARSVVTLELDPTVYEIIRQNPWSARLFTTPNIETRTGDSSELITEFADGSFDAILHDPPMFNLAGELYGLDFYRECRRVLRTRGRLFHYIGNPESKSGATVTRGVVRRLQEAGFRRVTPHPEAFGVTATL